MKLTQDEFSRIVALRPARRREAPEVSSQREGQAAKDAMAEVLGANVGKNRYGEHLVLRRWFSSPEAFTPACDALRLLLAPQLGQTRVAMERLADPAEWLFLDTETTGLAGGTGTYAFLVGLAWWEDGGLQIEQFFMRNHDEEFSLLLAVSRRLADRRLLVTFNGKSFDWPLLDTRFRMTRAISARPPAAHLDLLHPARQLWRLRLGSVRLIELEEQVLGAGCARLDWSRRDDIDAALIPQIYFDYLRGGPVEPLASIFRHNQMDLRGLAALASKVLALLGWPETAAAQEPDPLDLYGLSRLVHHRGDAQRARQLCERALGGGLPGVVRRLAQRELARLAKRQRDYPLALALWEEQLRTTELPSGPGGRSLRSGSGRASYKWAAAPGDKALAARMEAYEQLAIYYEHRAGQPQRAVRLTRQALAELEKALGAGRIVPGRGRRLQVRYEHRLARLTRKTRLLFAPGSASRQAAGESNPV